MMDSNGTYQVHSDHLGTPFMLTNSSKAVVWSAKKQAFGQTTVDEDPDANSTPITMNLRFPGQYYDTETQLHDNWHRSYNPNTGRYIQRDPIGLDAGVNVFAYVNGNPVMNLDVEGLLACDYKITSHTLICVSNSGATKTTGMVVSGNGEECKNNPACTNKKDEGPLPEGIYTIFSPTQTKHKKNWMFIKPNFVTERSGLFIHPGENSKGCIVIRILSDYSVIAGFANDDNGGTLNVSK